MKKLCIVLALLLIALPSAIRAETRTISWDPVTTYTDSTPIEPEKTVSYTAYWSVSPSLLPLVAIAIPTTATFMTFDPTTQGMIRGNTVYFTAKAMLNTGEESDLSPVYPWVVPPSRQPGPPIIESIT